MVEKTHSRENKLRKDLSRLVRMKEMKLGNPQLVKILMETTKLEENIIMLSLKN